MTLKVRIQEPVIPDDADKFWRKTLEDQLRDIRRFHEWQENGTPIESVMWKDEGREGPIWVNLPVPDDDPHTQTLGNGARVRMIPFGDMDPYSANIGWFRISVARKIAKILGVPFSEA